LFVIVDGRRWGIEVKHRFDINFTGLRDWPFEDMILSNVTAANRHRNVMAYATLSGDLRYAGIVRGDTRQHWHTVQTWCKNTHNVERFYATPLEYVTFERTIMP
jgi:hypothetical protein